jgi:predicted hydrolase (HD superfamily)
MSRILNKTEFGKESNKGNVLSRDEANALLNEWVLKKRLQLHMTQVAALMAAWAKEKEG